MTKKFVIIGAGGFAREVLDIFDACNENGHNYNVLGYIVGSDYGMPGERINDKPILGDFEWLRTNSTNVLLVCGVGAPEVRFRLIQKALVYAASYGNIVHPSAILTNRVSQGEDIIITAGCILTDNINIGNHVQINLGCTIGHDVIIDDFVTIAPGAHISGRVSIGMGCYIGTGVNIVERVRIGAWTRVGAGSTVINDVPPNTTVVGVPSRVVKTRSEGWYRANGIIRPHH